jgi:hypothetical protein
MWSKSQKGAIEPAVDRPVDHAPTRDGLPRRAGHGAVPDFITILEAGSRGGEVALSTRTLASATAIRTLERFIRDGKAASAMNPPATSAATKGAADTLRRSVSRVIDLRTDIVVIRADVTRTHGWSA